MTDYTIRNQDHAGAGKEIRNKMLEFTLAILKLVLIVALALAGIGMAGALERIELLRETYQIWYDKWLEKGLRLK